MATSPIEVDYIAVVRDRLKAMQQEDRHRLAMNVGLSISTIYNVRDGKDSKYSTVLKLYKATGHIQVPVKKAARKARAS